LYRVARELKCNKIALGHHRDDMLQTLFLNMFFGGKLKGMPAKLVSDNGEFMVIRPLAYVVEKDIVRWAEVQQYPIIPCTLCGSQENLQRKQVGDMLRDWDKRFPGRLESMLSALQNVVPSHLMDRKLYPFETIQTTGMPVEDGDIAFDDEPIAPPLRASGTPGVIPIAQPEASTGVCS
jgi:tRNA 2-thiocytidine biosynthesis protein TtcA